MIFFLILQSVSVSKLLLCRCVRYIGHIQILYFSRECPKPKATRGTRRGGGGGGDLKCYNCQESGHKSRDCLKPREAGRGGRGGGGTWSWCYKCRVSGHKVWECTEYESKKSRRGGMGEVRRGGGAGEGRSGGGAG